MTKKPAATPTAPKAAPKVAKPKSSAAKPIDRKPPRPAAARPAPEKPAPAKPAPDQPAINLDAIPTHKAFDSFLTTIPLNRLMLSALNVRQTERDADVASLAEDIAARGLKQNLVVVPAHFSTGAAPTERGTAMFEVIAGGRRYQALELLVTDGRLPDDYPVSCLIEPRNQASETSLSENLHRVAMNPADEFTAFAKIIAEQQKQGSSEAEAIAYTAKRFGVTVRHVQGRLRLSALQPDILEALRKGAISLDSAKAYAGSSDPDLQAKVFVDQCKPNTWKPHDPATVRQQLRQITVPLDDPLMKFVGLATYRAAGGRTEVEMFMGTDGDERALDGPLLASLAQAKAEPLVTPQAAADGFKSGILLTLRAGQPAIWPKAPEGFERFNPHYHGEMPEEADQQQWIAAYNLDEDCTGLDRIGCFRPKPEQAEQPSPRGYVPENDEARATRLRAEAIERKAAQLAACPFIDTDFEGRARWPKNSAWRIEPVDFLYEEIGEQNGDEVQPDGALVAILVRVTEAEIEAQRAQATRLHDQEAAAQAAITSGEVEDEGDEA